MTTTRNTSQKSAIQLAFAKADRPLSPDEVLIAASKKISQLSIATVYRNINAMVEDGLLAVVEVPGQPNRYEVAGKAHHHHFQCEHCDRVFELEGCFMQEKPRLPRGFRSTRHEVFFYGACSSCA